KRYGNSTAANPIAAVACEVARWVTLVRSSSVRRPVVTGAGLLARGSLGMLNGGCDKDPVSLPICVAAGVVVLPFVMRFYLGGFEVKWQVHDPLLVVAL